MNFQVPLFKKSDSTPPKFNARLHQMVGEGFDVKRFAENFAVLAEASKGVKSLRSLVLKLGLAGRLGTNDPKDAALVLSAPEPSLVGAAPHRNWVTRHLPDVAQIEMGNSPPGASYNEHGEGVPLINGPVEFSPGAFGVTRRTKFTTAPARMCRRGDLLVCVRGATTGRTNIADFDACIGRGVALVRARTNQEYLNYFMWSVGTDLLAAGTGTTFPAISRDDLAGLVVHLPPLAEQKRIVAKVDQLMALCDDLEARQTKKWEIGTRLTKSALEALTTAEGPEQFDAAWKRVIENFDLLIDRAEKVGELRGAIRNLAIRGVLTSRVAGEEPGANLLERIDHERQRRVRAKEARNLDPVPPVNDDEVPFSVPASWVWTRLGNLCWKVADGPHFSPKYVTKGEGFPFLSGRNIRADGFELESVKYVSAEDHRTFCQRTKPEPGDVLYTKGGTTGVALVNNLDFEFSVWVHVAVLKLDLANVFPEYVAMTLNGPHCYAQSQKLTHGTGNRDLGLTRMVLITLPLPPLKEQKLIVAKVERLMKICDDLEANLRRAEDRAAKLVEAVVQELVSGESAA